MIALVLALLASPAAHARDYDTYRSDYFRGAFCNAIGGACAADNDLVSGIFQNPAALADGQERWDFDGDYASRDVAEPGYRGDSGSDDSTAAGGVAWSPGRWGVALGLTWRRTEVDSLTVVTGDGGLPRSTRLFGTATTLQLRLPVAYAFANGLSVGATLSLTRYQQHLDLADPTARVSTAPADTKLRFTLGAQLPVSGSVRLGSWFRLPLSTGSSVAFQSVATGLETFREDYVLHAPWIWGTGVAWLAHERLALYSEADLVGPTRDGFLFSYEDFTVAGSAQHRPKGRRVVLEPHAGGRYDLTSRLRAHAGAYYENSRWEDVRGRLHTTLALSYQLLGLDWIAGVDLARNYTQLFFTFR